jgi:outer membrane receptor protein involved in Fe transport
MYPVKRPQFPLSAIVLALAVVPTAGHGQQRMLEEVIVTAQKRVESLQDVPIAVSAMSGEKIDQQGITDLGELTLFIPNVNINQGQAQPNLFIRGVGSGTNAGFEQSVGLYIDGVFSGRGQLAAVPITMDLERVEVLKGPQGTLFGRNTIGGAINITTARPDFEFEAMADALYEPDHGEQIYHLTVNGGLTDNIAGRLALRYDAMDGWWDNKLLNEEGPDRDNLYVRGSLLFEPTETLEVIAKYEYGDFEQKGKPLVVYQSDQPLNFRDEEVFPVVDDIDEAAFDVSDDRQTDTDVAVLTVNWDLDFAGFTSISAYSAYELNTTTNSDFSATQALHRKLDEDFEQFSQELRLVSPGGETLDWIIGAYYENNELEVSRRNPAADFALNGPLVVAALIALLPAGEGEPTQFDQDTDTWSVFGQGTYSITDTWRVTAGLRYNDETKDLDKRVTSEVGARGTSVGLPDLIVFTDPATGEIISDLRSHNWQGLDMEKDKWTWSLNTQWDATDSAMLYASVSTGFKSGGFDEAYTGPDETIRTSDDLLTGIPDGGVVEGEQSSVLEYSEETVIAYEIGAKMTLAGGLAELNVAVFRSEYDDLQTSSLVGDVFRVGNAGESVTQGIELDGRWAATDKLTLAGSIGYLDAEYDDFTGATCTIPQQADPVNNPGCLLEDGTNIAEGEEGGQDLSGEDLLFAPEWSANFNATWIQPLGDNLELLFSLDVNYSEEYYSSLDLDPNTKHDSATLYNGRISLSGDNGRWSISVLGKNLSDEETHAWRNDVPLTASDSYFAVPNRPRSIAVQGRYYF